MIIPPLESMSENENSRFQRDYYGRRRRRLRSHFPFLRSVRSKNLAHRLVSKAFLFLFPLFLRRRLRSAAKGTWCYEQYSTVVLLGSSSPLSTHVTRPNPSHITPIRIGTISCYHCFSEASSGGLLLCQSNSAGRVLAGTCILD